LADRIIDRQNEGDVLNESDLGEEEPRTGGRGSGQPTDARGFLSMPDAQPAIDLAMKLGRALSAAGSASYRVEEALTRVCERLGVRGQFFAAPTELMYSFQVGREEWTYMQRLEPGQVNLGRLAALEGVALGVIRGSSGPEEAAAEVERITSAAGPVGAGAMLAGHALASGSAAWFFGGGPAEIALSLLAGLLLGLLALAFASRPAAARLQDALGAALVAALAGFAAARLAGLSAPIVSLAGLIVLLPGLTLTTAVGELAHRHLQSGTARLAQAGVVFLMLGFGALAGGAAGEALGAALPGAPRTLDLPALPGWSEALAVIVAGVAFTILFQAPRREAPWITLLCAAAYAGGTLGDRLGGASAGAFLGALVAGLGSSVYARLADRPAVVTRVPAMTMLVPGSIGFLSVSSLLIEDATSGVQTAFKVALVAVSLTAGLLTATTLLPPRRLL
jgi:uncharacterized membrane protein YjjP (DUF1212 family)